MDTQKQKSCSYLQHKIFVMKKIVLAAITIVVYTSMAAQHGGSIVVEVKSITCQNKSFDGVVEFDGPGNEVFVSGAFFARNPSSATFKINRNVFTSTTFGSTAGHNERKQAGTASPTGGIDNNNTFNCDNYPIASTQLDPDGFMLVSPTLWERDDDNETIYNRYKAQVLSDLESASLMPFPNFGVDATDPFNGKIYKYGNGYQVSIPPNSYPAIFSPLVNAPGNRPMGITSFAGQALMFDPTIILLDAKNLWAIYNQTPVDHPYPNASYPWKVVKEIALNCGERTYAIDGSNGRYTVNIVIRFAPEADDITASREAAKNPTVIKLPSRNIRNVSNINIPIKTIATPYTMNNEMLYGAWNGSIQMNDGSKAGRVAFKFNNGVFWLQDAGGASVASGGFKIENNNFSSTYSYANGDSYRISSATYNANTGQLSGTLTSNVINAAKKGNWVVTKQSN